MMRQLFSEHLSLNKYKILDTIDHDKLESPTEMKFYRDERTHMIYINNDYLHIFYPETGEELSIPQSLISTLTSLKVNDYYSNYTNELEDEIGNFLVVLHTLANNLFDKNFIINLLRYIFHRTTSDDLNAKWIRDEMYDRLGVIVGYVIYSSPTDYKFY